DLLDSWFLGLLVGAAAGGVLALVHAFSSVQLRADQIVSGVALNFLALGITGYIFLDHYGDQGTPDNIPRVPDISIPAIKNLSFLGGATAHANTLPWVALILVAALTVFLFRTPRGLRLRSVGEHPRAAETVGISVIRTRYLAVVTSGMLAALGGAYLSIGFGGSFNQGMTAGRGFIALAAVIFGNWRPGGALAAALLFGFSTALAQRLPAFSPSAAVLFQALPYVLTLIAVAGIIGRSRPPAAVGQPYVKESRCPPPASACRRRRRRTSPPPTSPTRSSSTSARTRRCCARAARRACACSSPRTWRWGRRCIRWPTPTRSTSAPSSTPCGDCPTRWSASRSS